MLERGLVSRILFPAPPPSYDVDCFPHDLIWVPKASSSAVERSEDPADCPPVEDCVPCLLLMYPSARFLIIFFHSNAEDLGRCHGFCCYIRDQFQVHVLAVEYPGYGICPGVPCGETVMENALAAMKFVTDTLQWPMDSIKVFGRSIGTGPAIGLASLFSLAGLILVTPFLSVQELFRDRVGPFASLVEEWFPNSDSAPKITSPTMIIHGQRDELIACRHGESIYELLRPRKLLISPPEMEHNTNLLTNLQFFVLPMFQFFALPDYAFQDVQVPPWAYDKRRSPYYIRPSVEVSSHRLPNFKGKKKMLIPAGDDGSMPASLVDSAPDQPAEGELAEKLRKASEKAVNGEALGSSKKPNGRQLEPMFSSKVPYDSTVAQETPISVHKSATSGATSRNGVRSLQGPRGRSKDNVSPAVFSPEAREVLQRLEDNGQFGAGEICSDELCVLEERTDPDAEEVMKSQEKALADLLQGRQGQRGGCGPAAGLPVAPRLLAAKGCASNGGASCGPQTMWPSWCGKQPLVVPEVSMRTGKVVPAPGLPPAETGVMELPRSPRATSPYPSPPSPLPRSSGLVQVLPSSSGSKGKSPRRSADAIHSASARLPGSGGLLKNPLWASCCRAPPCDELVTGASPPRIPRPHAGSDEGDPFVPFGGRVISGSHQPLSPEEETNWRKYPLGSAALPRRPSNADKDVKPKPVSTGGFQRGTKFAI